MPKALDIIQFRCTADTFGRPAPHIDDGAIVIMYQDGIAEIGRYEAPRPPEEPSPAFDHPVNTDELKPEALQAVRSAHPRLNSFERGYVLLCPDLLAKKARWRTRAS
jgi:hypothetical protein